jgi:hypothetical protein
MELGVVTGYWERDVTVTGSEARELWTWPIKMSHLAMTLDMHVGTYRCDESHVFATIGVSVVIVVDAALWMLKYDGIVDWEAIAVVVERFRHSYFNDERGDWRLGRESGGEWMELEERSSETSRTVLIDLTGYGCPATRSLARFRVNPPPFTSDWLAIYTWSNQTHDFTSDQKIHDGDIYQVPNESQPKEKRQAWVR